jgi:hypothetical protein
MKRHPLVLFALSAALVSGPVAVADAQRDPSDPPPKCFESGPNFELPTCTKNGDGSWKVSYPDSAPATLEDDGIPGGFAVLLVLALVGGVGFTVWKVSMARQMATEAGLDPGRATAVTLLSDDGLDATYIATSLHAREAAQQPPASPARSTAERLTDLQKLRDDGLVTADEYDARRQAILESL